MQQRHRQESLGVLRGEPRVTRQERRCANREPFAVEQFVGHEFGPLPGFAETDRQRHFGLVEIPVIGGCLQKHPVAGHPRCDEVEARHQPCLREIVAAADHECIAVVRGQILDRLPDGAETLADRFGQRVAGAGDGDAVAFAREQLDRQLALEIGDMPADRRLCDVELLRGQRQPAMPGGSLEDDHGVQQGKRCLEGFHDPNLHSCLFDMEVYYFCICGKPFRIAHSIEKSS